MSIFLGHACLLTFATKCCALPFYGCYENYNGQSWEICVNKMGLPLIIEQKLKESQTWMQTNQHSNFIRNSQISSAPPLVNNRTWTYSLLSTVHFSSHNIHKMEERCFTWTNKMRAYSRWLMIFIERWIALIFLEIFSTALFAVMCNQSIQGG